MAASKPVAPIKEVNKAEVVLSKENKMKEVPANERKYQKKVRSFDFNSDKSRANRSLSTFLIADITNKSFNFFSYFSAKASISSLLAFLSFSTILFKVSSSTVLLEFSLFVVLTFDSETVSLANAKLQLNGDTAKAQANPKETIFLLIIKIPPIINLTLLYHN